MAGVTVQINALRQLSECGDFLGDLAGHQMAGQARFGAYAHNNFQCVGSFNVTKGKGYAAG
jgi:hypothetical protein